MNSLHFRASKTSTRTQKIMKTPTPPLVRSTARAGAAPWPLALILLSTLLLAGGWPDALGATAGPPTRMTYQGYLVDASGQPLTTNEVKNFNVRLAIYNHPTDGLFNASLWAEEQTVSVDRGYFSAVLGEGQKVAGSKMTFSDIFVGADASDRYIEIQVQAIGGSSGYTIISPRLRLVTAPYAFNAQTAMSATSASTAQTAVTLQAGANIDGGTIKGTKLTIGNNNSNTGFQASVPGGELNTAAGRSSFAAGTNAKALHDGCFVWSDSTQGLNLSSISSTAPDQFIIRSKGGVGIGRVPATIPNAATGQPFLPAMLQVEGDASKTTAGQWAANSDARIKTDVTTVQNALNTLDRVRLVSFRYTPEYRAAHPTMKDREYLNIIAQEFKEVFPDWVTPSGEKLATGEDILQVDTYPLTIYSAAAVQELRREKNADLRAVRQLVDTKESEVRALKDEVQALRKQVDRLLQVTAQLEP
jgi:hypothetical protein